MSNLTLLLSKMLGSRKGAAAPPTYTISGTITGTSVSGATVALTGDATDSTTSDGSGNYSFTGLSNGSYTITPTLTDYEFTPASINVTISDADDTDNDFVSAGPFLALPYTYNVSDVSQTSGDVGGVIDGWVAWTGRGRAVVVTSSLGDASSFTPTGVTKAFRMAGASDGEIFNLPRSISASGTKLRFAMLVKSSATNAASSIFINNLTAAQYNADPTVSTGQAGGIWNTSTNPDQITSYSRYGNTTEYSEWNATSMGDNFATNRWYWYRWEYDFTGEKLRFALYRVQDGASIFSGDVAMNAAGVSLGHIPTGMKSILWVSFYAAVDDYVAKFWIGDQTDDWPTT